MDNKPRRSEFRCVNMPFSFLINLTCGRCRLPVTGGPTYVQNSTYNICGRCSKNIDDNFRNYAYETLASIFLYPCKNWSNYCPERLSWNDILHHEEECEYTGCCTFLCSHPGAFFKGQREIPLDEVNLIVLPEQLFENLECTECGGYLSCFPVLIKPTGGNVCHRCVHMNRIPASHQRNVLYETIAQIFIFPCTYRNRGCTERFPFGEGIKNHEIRCHYSREPYGNVLEEVSSRITPSTEMPSNYRENYPAYENHSSNQEPSPKPNAVIEQPRNSGKKQKGVVQRGISHFFFTVTPNKPLFLPPDDTTTEYPPNREVFEEIKKHERHIRHANEISQDMLEKISDNDSTTTNESSYKHRHKSSGNSTPDLLEENRRPYYTNEDHFSRPVSRESGYQTPPIITSMPQHEYDYNYLKGEDQLSGLSTSRLNDRYENKRLSSRESIRNDSNKAHPLLITELKITQDRIKRTHSIKDNKESGGPHTRYPKKLNDITEKQDGYYAN
ncbi:hypothetical protein ABEB36_008822 [Hypothenemus hampei]|uniref:RING-type E3 ubiquitin transferase n=1 Tax=Hypothenemus hampei TaxID=57062 RepID=A0ABD1EN69_HYPHA